MAPPAPAKADIKKKATSGARTDPFIGSRDVVGLNSHNITEFLSDKDVALVMFYEANDPQCLWSKKHFLKAAKTTVRDNTAFAAVDCVLQKDFCAIEGAVTVPYFKLYSKGKMFAAYNKPKEFTYHTMKQYVEKAPILTEATRPKRPC